MHNTIFNFKLKFHLEDSLAEQRYFELFSAFAVILVKFSAPKSFIFSVVNMGYKLLKKRSKYELRIFLDEKQRFSFANFLHLFIQGSSLTYSALLGSGFVVLYEKDCPKY